MNDQLEKLKSAWQKNQDVGGKNQLDEEVIMEFLKGQSNDIAALFRKGLVFDFILKSALILSFIGLLFIYQTNASILGLNIVLIAATAVLLFVQTKYYKLIPGLGSLDANIKDILESEIEFFNKKYIKALYIGALSNPLLFLSGMMYYFYYKYGTIRPLDGEDFIVFSIGILLSFVIAAVAQVKQTRFQIGQLETSMNDLDEESMTELKIKQMKNQQVRVLIAAVISIALGLLVLSYVLAR